MVRECYIEETEGGWMHDGENWEPIKILCGGTVHRVRITELVDGDETANGWAWRDDVWRKFKDGEFVNEPLLHMIYSHRELLEMAFPYGSEIEEKECKGKVVQVRVEILETMWRPEEDG